MTPSPIQPALPLTDASRSCGGLRRSPWPRVVGTGIVIGMADLEFAAAYWGQYGVAPVRIPQSIAAWALGAEAALGGGWTTALLGTLLYCYLTTLMVECYRQFAARRPRLLRRPFVAGPVYGVCLYVLLFEILVPLFARQAPAGEPLAWTLACLVAYAFLIGLPCALFASAWPADVTNRSSPAADRATAGPRR